MSSANEQTILAFNAFIKECEVFLSIARDSELQRETCSKLQAFLDKLQNLKRDAVRAGDEDFANLLLGFECVAKCLRAELRMWLLLKEENPDEAWDELVCAQMAALDAVRAHGGFSHVEHQHHRLELIEQMIFPPQVFVSAGLLVRRQICSICGAEYGECEHLAGKAYWGQFCSILAEGISGDHVAVVKNPADKRCRVTHFPVEAGNRNRMTWKAEPSDSGPQHDDGDKSRSCEAIIYRLPTS